MLSQHASCMYMGQATEVNFEVGAQLLQPATCEPRTEIWGAPKQTITARWKRTCASAIQVV